MSNITVLIPCLNEAKTIYSVINDIKKHYPYLPLIVVDNGSTDGTIEIVESTGIKLIHEARKGKALAIKAALPYINSEFVFLMDADNEYKIESMQYLMKEDVNRHTMIIGVRPKSKMLLRSRLANNLIKFCLYLRYKRTILDCLTGMRIVPTGLLHHVKSHGFELETELNLLCIYNNIQIIATPIQYEPRIIGKKIKLLDMFKLLKVAIQ